MTDGHTGHGSRGDGGPNRLTLVLGGGLAFVLLAAIGATGGWMLAGADDSPVTPVAEATATGSPTTRERSTRPAVPRPQPTTPRTTAAPAPSGGLTVPPVVGMDFEKAREELREERLGWRLVFGSGTGRAVERATPAVGERISRGRTVTLYVGGPAPTVEVPDVVGEPCSEAADELVDDGFYPAYPVSRAGVVSRQEPAADSTARWNDRVSIWCGSSPSGTPTAVPTP
ncbi:PASTA domain-containing protein [Micromonospora endolithica]|uniref:PASTA domain-containing protein n=1 Tax=Micromonospora endolithica TaxID=230091 RepID=A0A3A9ZD97_9ACTN|nr:PASTA domain-containing protein [Micromonospora endolithica]RKN46392.1 PASTA domain-containing protein [Micromonospora endolithica]TWJ24867.1 PASTA domain-containing protein [Micromonospora endolithica]